VEQAVQIVGAVLILVAFAGVQFGRVDPTSPFYLWLNLVGSVILAVLAYAESQWGFVLLEGVWSLVSAHGLIQLARGRRPGGAH
jgi:membrane-bound ClpP family serine protease